ncbi:MAG: hypothetical protein ACREU0_08620, partial [Burkholderiales bacterium]
LVATLQGLIQGHRIAAQARHAPRSCSAHYSVPGGNGSENVRVRWDSRPRPALGNRLVTTHPAQDCACGDTQDNRQIGWRLPAARLGSAIALKNSGKDFIGSAVNCIFGAPVW